jgi:hypothetical protein
MDVFIFTLGLTEAWVHKTTGRVYPTAPGTIAGSYDPAIHEFRNFGFEEIRDDFVDFHRLIRRWNPEVRIILTVSPVPLTATATHDHVLLATTYSKSVLRSVAGALAEKFPNIDYFPSYELIASPWSKGFFYDANMRSVNPSGVAAVMRVFFDQHRIGETAAPEKSEKRWARRERRIMRRERRDAAADETKSTEDAICEDVLLEAFAP